MHEIDKIFAPVLGNMVWGVTNSHGSFLVMEFGSPHLSVREPVIARPGTSARVRRRLKHRRVSIVGDFHFWVQYGNWLLSTTEGVLESSARRHAHHRGCREPISPIVRFNFGRHGAHDLAWSLSPAKRFDSPLR